MKKKKKSILETEITIGGVSLMEKVAFARNLKIMLKAGIPITEALEIAGESTSGKLKKIIGRIRSSVKAGNQFSESLSDYPRVFSQMFIGTTHAGELSGTLEENLENIADHLEKEGALISKIKSAMVYPIIVLIGAGGLAAMLSFVVLPKIVPLLEGLKIDLPLTTRGLIWFSQFVEENTAILAVSIIGGLALIIWLIRSEFMKPVTHWILLYTPIIKNVARNANLARFARTLGTLLKSGLSIDEALDITKDTIGNYYYKQALARTSERITRGGNKLSKNLMQYPSLFPAMATRMIRVAEESGTIEETLLYIGEVHDRKIDAAIKSLSAAIEPILLIVVGLGVGFLALSIITPIYDVTGGIK